MCINWTVERLMGLTKADRWTGEDDGRLGRGIGNWGVICLTILEGKGLGEEIVVIRRTWEGTKVFDGGGRKWGYFPLPAYLGL